MRSTWPVWLVLGAALATGPQACGRAYDDGHANPSFPLRDAHAVECAACHGGSGAFTELSTACASCHEQDRPPNHHEGQDCGGCHQPTNWDADFDHDQLFPTPHHGVSECSDCHIGGDTTSFSCTDCHEHSASRTNPEHDEVGGYEYESRACLDCHRRGEGDD